MSGFESSITEPIKQVFRAKCFKGQNYAEGNTMAERTVLAGNDKVTATRLLSDQRGAASLEMTIVAFFMMVGLLVPLADLAITGLKFNSAYQALRDMGQRTQFSPPADVTSSTSIASWQSSLPSSVDGYSVSAQVYCGNPGTLAPCASAPANLPKFYTFTTSFALSPMVLGKMLCSTCTVTYSQPFQ
jgi:Flp pilus assembly protein TadG